MYPSIPVRGGGEGCGAWKYAGEDVEEGGAEDQVHWPADIYRDPIACTHS